MAPATPPLREAATLAGSANSGRRNFSPGALGTTKSGSRPRIRAAFGALTYPKSNL
ncbi:MAG: hypothetical protein HY720_20195 [Planctomycetes bacterium]|nr:hypothetical protein [Planctomycetota bacterium]